MYKLLSKFNKLLLFVCADNDGKGKCREGNNIYGYDDK